MKRKTIKVINWLRIHRYQLEKRKLRKIIKQDAFNKAWNDFVKLKAPSSISLLKFDQQNDLIHFIQNIRNIVYFEKKKLLIDFTPTTKLMAAGTVLLKAELDRLIEIMTPKPTIRCLPPKNNKASQVLKHIGLYDLLQTACNVIPKDGDVVFWRHCSDNSVIGEKYDEVLGHHVDNIAESLTNSLYISTTEAMTNCVNHAYIDKRDDNIDTPDGYKKWWMFSQERDNKLSVAICDLGVGIPNTLTKSPRWLEFAKKLFSTQPNDATVIAETIKESRTRHNQKHRGKGLGQITKTITSIPDGEVFIMSNTGCYTYRNGKEASFSFPSSILGTVIAWNIPLPNNAEA